MIAHISNYFESQALLLGKKGLGELIRNGYKRATKYNLITGYEVCLYIDLMILLGHAFDTDPQYPWAMEILTDRKIAGPTERIELLYKRALGFIEMVMDTDRPFPAEQRQKMTGFSFDELNKTISASKDIAGLLHQFWPAKCKLVSQDALRQLIQTGSAMAKEAGFTKEVNIAYYVLLMFLFGYRFDADPQYPWLMSVLNDPELKDELYKVTTLQFMVKNHLEKILISHQ